MRLGLGFESVCLGVQRAGGGGGGGGGLSAGAAPRRLRAPAVEGGP